MAMYLGPRSVRINSTTKVTLFVSLNQYKDTSLYYFVGVRSDLTDEVVALEHDEAQKPSLQTIESYNLENGKMVKRENVTNGKTA